MARQNARDPQEDVVGREHAELDRVRSEVLEQEGELLTHDVRERRERPMYTARRLHVERGGHRHAVHAVQREDPQVQLESGSAGRVGARDRERGGSLRRLGSHPGRLAQRAAALLFALWLPFAAAAEAPTVIVLSWDGTRWDYPDRTELPALDRVRKLLAEGRLRDDADRALILQRFPYGETLLVIAEQFLEDDDSKRASCRSTWR